MKQNVVIRKGGVVAIDMCYMMHKEDLSNASVERLLPRSSLKRQGQRHERPEALVAGNALYDKERLQSDWI